MKMFMPLTVKESGVIQWKLSEGAALNPGDIIAKLELDDPSCVKKADTFTGSISRYVGKTLDSQLGQTSS
jgi:acetyl-CoA carboxylase/biotin carboxylase 1